MVNLSSLISSHQLPMKKAFRNTKLEQFTNIKISKKDSTTVLLKKTHFETLHNSKMAMPSLLHVNQPSELDGSRSNASSKTLQLTSKNLDK